MTEKQIERLQQKIRRIKKELAADKKFWGGYYHDGRGLRYLPPEYYIELEDYKGAKRYFNWFNKNFPDDMCSPYFLFQWAFVLFKTRDLKQAENKVLEVYNAESDLIHEFFKKENSTDGFEFFKYRAEKHEFEDFGEWLEKLIKPT